MRVNRSVLVFGMASLALLIISCGGNPINEPPLSISVTIQNPPASVVVGSSVTFSAVVLNDTSGAGVTWTVNCASSACGGFTPASSAGNSPITTFSAPAAIPTGNTLTVIATSVADPTKSASASIAVIALFADGNYVYKLSGQDANGPYFLAGVFTVSNGFVTGGEQDYVDVSRGSHEELIAANSTIIASQSGNFQLALATDDSQLGVNGIETFRGILVSGSHAQITEFDYSVAAGGTLDLQTSVTPPSGGYAFNLEGVDGSAITSRLFIGGVVTVTGMSVSVTNSIFDYFDGGAVGLDQSFDSGVVTAPDAMGRITIDLTPSFSSGGVEFSLIGYIVDIDKIQLVESVSDTLGGTLGGAALGQGFNAGNFSASGVGGGTYIFIARGEDELNGIATFAGLFTLNSNGTVSGSLAYNDFASAQLLSITGGNWSVGALGRVSISNVTVNGSNIGDGPFAFQLYLDGSGNALELGSDPIEGSVGPGYRRIASPSLRGGKYAISGQGTVDTESSSVWTALGPVVLDTSLNWSGLTDYYQRGAIPVPNRPLSGATNTSTGLFSLVGLNASSPSMISKFDYYPIDDTRVLAVEMDTNQLGLLILESRDR